MSALTSEVRHMLFLVRKGRDSEGWAKVSNLVFPLLADLPAALVTVEATETGGRAKLTPAGEIVLDWT